MAQPLTPALSPKGRGRCAPLRDGALLALALKATRSDARVCRARPFLPAPLPLPLGERAGVRGQHRSLPCA